ncbi:MAG: hypothetical protein O7B98_10355 [Alphaproteobacteria bacterium]|nr:hypothetical protein [Alphaproteobacteria bacterium]
MMAFETIRLQKYVGVAGAARAMLGGFVVVLAMLSTTVLTGGPAYAQSQCDVRKSLLAKLDTGYAERPVAVGLASTGNVVELLISTDGTWTILVTKPNGIACIAAVGEEWQALEPVSTDKSS